MDKSITPWAMSCRYAKIYKKIKHFPFNWKVLRNIIRNPDKLLRKISYKNGRWKKLDSPELYAAKVSVVLDRFHVPYKVYLGKAWKGEEIPEPERVEEMFLNDECNCIWVEFDGNLYFSMGKDFAENKKYNFLYSFGDFSYKHHSINKLGAFYFPDVQKSPKLQKPSESDILVGMDVDSV